MTSNQHGPLTPWDTVLHWPVQRVAKAARRSQSQKTGPSSDISLQLDFLKSDSLVIVNQHAPVNMFSDLYSQYKRPTALMLK